MKLVFCIINAQIDQTKRKIEICSVSHNRNAKWEMRNPKPKPESSKPENQNSSKPETNPSTKSKSKSKTKTMREANENANQNSKRNHIMTIAKRSDNAKCEIKFAFAPVPVPLAPCCLCWLHSILVQTMIALGRHRCVAAATKYCTLAMAICHSLVCARILWHRGGHIEPLPALRGVYVLRSQAVLSWTGHGRTECSASF